MNAGRASTPVAVAAPIATAAPEPVPFDRASDPNGAALEALSTELVAAGRRARSRKAQAMVARPDPTFAEALRGRLTQAAGAGAGSAATGTAVSAPAQALPARTATAATPRALLDAEPGPLWRPRSAVQAGPAVHRKTSRRAWAVIAIGGLVLALAAAGLATGRFSTIPANRVGEATNATLIRTTGSQALVAGTALAVGDEIRVAAGGHATLLFGSSQTRLAGGADLRLNNLSSSVTQLALLAGRAYHRVVVPAGGSYAVVTGSYTWTATGTAFDLDRTPAASGGEQVTLLALEHGVAVDGPGTHQQVAEGSSMTVRFGNPGTDGVTIGPIPTSVFSDPWLINNAKLDESLGYPIGALAGVALAPNDTPSASPGPSLTPTDSPSDDPSPSPSVAPSASPSPTPGLTPNPTPTASPSPSPAPTATPRPSVSLSLTSCPGGIVLNWTKYSGAGFVRYVTLRSTNLGMSGATQVASAETTSRTRTSAADSTVAGGPTYFYRTIAMGSGNSVLAASDVTTAPGLAIDVNAIDPLSITTTSTGTRISWRYYDHPACFTEYRLLTSSTSSDPDAGNSVADSTGLGLWTTSSTNVPASGGWTGQTVHFRVQVIRLVGLESFVVAQTSDVVSYDYP